MKRLYGVIGYPVSHSLSPVFQQVAFDFTQIEAAYVPFEIRPENLALSLDAMDLLGVGGFNVTLPHKEAVFRLVQDRDPVALRVGAVNTVVRRSSGWLGANTDVGGFQSAFLHFADRKIRSPLSHPLVLGAGGAARSVIFALQNAGFSRITIANRTPERAEHLLDSLFSGEEKDGLDVLPLEKLQKGGEFDVIINTLSRGAFGEGFPILEGAGIEAVKGMFDLSYQTDGRPTPFLQAGISAGIPWEDGLGMLLEQGALSFELWTGKTAPRHVMKEALFRRLNRPVEE